MFKFLDDELEVHSEAFKEVLEDTVSTAAGRYSYRKYYRWVLRDGKFPRTRHYFWWVVHNLLAHPLLVVPCKPTFWLHDWTSARLNNASLV